MKNFGFAGYEDVIYIGTNSKMSEICAAMGLTGLESIEEFVMANNRNYETYRDELALAPGIRLLPCVGTDRRNYQYVIVEIDPSKVEITRGELQQVLWAENVLARRYFYPVCHRMEPYRSFFPHAGLLLPETEKITERVLTLPTGTSMDPNQVSLVCYIIQNALDKGPRG